MAQAILEAESAVLPEPAPRRRGGKPRERGLLVLAVPAVVWYVLFTIGPLLAMFVIAFMNWRGLNAKVKFNGTANFDKLVHDDRILVGVERTMVHLVGSLPIMMVGAFMLGYFLNLKLPGHRTLRIIMFIPALISTAAMGMLFVAVLGPTGMVNSVLQETGLAEGTAWLANPDTAMLCLIGITIWSGLGFTAILFAARLSAIDTEIFAAAEIDGANHWQKMWQVAFPICRDYFGVLSMLQYLWTLFGSAGLILIITRGGPGDATMTLSWMVYDLGFNRPQVGYSQAVGLILFILGVVGLIGIRRTFRARY